MSVVGAIVLLFAGLTGLLASWNAARPLIDPTRRYSPSWLPAMVITEIAPFWLIVHGLLLGFGLAFGGWSNWGGRIGAGAIVVSMLLLVSVIARSMSGVRRLRGLIDGPVHGARGRSRVIGRPVPARPGVTETHRIEWRPGLSLDLVRPSSDARELPVLVYVHGGGWTGGDPQRQAREMYHALALAGWATLAIRYPFTPDVTVEEQVDTVKAAVRWARADLARHGIEATHVALAGGSAGAHLATMATLDATTERIDACVGIYGVYDLANRTRQRAPWAKIANDVMLARVSEARDRYDALSPLVQVTADSPPMLIVHGTRDTLVPIGEAEQFVGALEAKGRPVDFVRVEGAQHAFDALSSPTTRATAALIRDWLHRTVVAH